MYDPISHDPRGYRRWTFKDVDYPAHNMLAERAAVESMTLLKNLAGKTSLPLDVRAVKTLAVIGPLADSPAATQGQLYGGAAPFVVTPLRALQNVSGLHVLYRNGSGVVDSNASMVPAACAAARTADASVLVLGITTRAPLVESEGHDRTDILLPQIQLDLASAVAAVAAEADKPAVIGLITGGGVDVSSLQSNPNIRYPLPSATAYCRRLVSLCAPAPLPSSACVAFSLVPATLNVCLDFACSIQFDTVAWPPRPKRRHRLCIDLVRGADAERPPTANLVPRCGRHQDFDDRHGSPPESEQ